MKFAFSAYLLANAITCAFVIADTASSPPGLAPLGSGNESERVAASDALVKQGEKIVPALLEAINKDGGTARKMAEQTLMRIVHQAAGAGRQAELAKLLAV